MTSLRIKGCVAAIFMLIPGQLTAQDFTAGQLVIQHPWARATPKGAKVAVGYLTITNHGTMVDTLEGGSLSVARRFAIHEMTMNNGVMRMRESAPLDIRANGSLILSPSGKHIMFTDLQRGLQQGEIVDGTLIFAHAGTVPIRFTVESIGATTPKDAPSHPSPEKMMQ